MRQCQDNTWGHAVPFTLGKLARETETGTEAEKGTKISQRTQEPTQKGIRSRQNNKRDKRRHKTRQTWPKYLPPVRANTPKHVRELDLCRVAQEWSKEGRQNKGKINPNTKQRLIQRQKRHDPTLQGKKGKTTRQGEARQGKARQDNTIQYNARQGKATQGGGYPGCKIISYLT